MNTNIGKYDGNRLSEMVSVVEEFGLISKEHNGDYINNEVIESLLFLIKKQSFTNTEH